MMRELSDMADSAQVPRPLRGLGSEGNSTSARPAITILGLSGPLIEVGDPAPCCLARSSRLVRKFHCCRGLRDDPAGFLAFVERLLTKRHLDMPIHQQEFLFARLQARRADRIGLAPPNLASYLTAHGKAGPHRLLAELGLPQPVTRIVRSSDELRGVSRFPCVVKTSVGTASRGIWFVRDKEDLDRALQELGASGAFADEVLVQEFVAGVTEKAQAVFCRGPLIGCHAHRQIAVGGGEAGKQSVSKRGRCLQRSAKRSPGTPRCRTTISCPMRGHAASRRLRSAPGRADERLSCRHRSRRRAASGLVGRNTRGHAGKPCRHPDASCHAGAAWMCVVGRWEVRYFMRMRKFYLFNFQLVTR